ncbi:DUF5133 domain-containing protein [Streptomyces chrestomyceticus JCM 4735]|uniref:DUF5133 domain-containing protein n=1 Tax=Streptomyces chrestomyceticus JCM 4735 TaxID=1306181 RepID=A0A7U9PVA0_9ACTN|nr:DUF5133 domain-containing protein [Streptomyces chrestomyceticus]GCD32963.1 DUF5133 domain-containing protein [Streptomyces chrestomyceticus JCM 4735]
MLTAHPAILRDLVEQYETLRILHAEEGTPASRQRLEDVSYTLCVSTGTRRVEEALAVARRQLAAAPRVTDASHRIEDAAPAAGTDVRLTA